VAHFNNRTRAALDPFQVSGISSEQQMKRVTELAKTLDRRDYWYRVYLIRAGDKNYFLFEARSVKPDRNPLSASPVWSTFIEHPPVAACYLVPYWELVEPNSR
jgi:hypothetical protein